MSALLGRKIINQTKQFRPFLETDHTGN